MPAEGHPHFTALCVGLNYYEGALIALPPPDSKTQPGYTHSDDFRSVNWYGAEHQFTPTQARAVRYLIEKHEAGGLPAGQEVILQAADSSRESLAKVFTDDKGRKHAAWATMIVATGQGMFRLAVPGDGAGNPA